MPTEQTSTSKQDDDIAIHEILLKIFKKWCNRSLSIESANEDPHLNAIEIDNGDNGFTEEEIIMETVLLRPEDFQLNSPSQNIRKENDIPETIEPHTIEQAEEYIPETVIRNLNTIEEDQPCSSEPPEMEIPETVIFSPDKTNISSATDGRGPQKQEGLGPVKDSECNGKSSKKEDKDNAIPETVILRVKKDNGE